MLSSSGKPMRKVDSVFAKDILDGLTQHPKKLSSKYFYDETGDRIFQEIMAMPEYYLTNAEFEIFEQHKARILEKIGPEPFELIELGAGDGYKTKILLHHFLDAKANFTYRPIDISGSVLAQLEQSCASELPGLDVEPLQGDYFEVIKALQQEHDRVRKVILFLGSNIGNYTPDQAEDFLSKLSDNLEPGDLLFIGIDLKKAPNTIITAYDDPAGITERFNKNLLVRINRELCGNFDLEQFLHWATYDPITGATRSFLISTTDQTVQLQAINATIRFEAWESIDMEISQKYSLSEIHRLAKASGFEPLWDFTDAQGLFVDTLWGRNAL
ncbi:MAG: L-histidine N(alpha)-methyltransferase [Bacteroidota bacterium]